MQSLAQETCVYTLGNNKPICGKVIEFSEKHLVFKTKENITQTIISVEKIVKIRTKDPSVIFLVKNDFSNKFKKIQLEIDSTTYNQMMTEKKNNLSKKSIVRIYRSSNFVGSMINYRLYFGGKFVESISNNEALEFEFISEGETCIWFEAKKEFRLKMSIDLKPGMVQYYKFSIEFGRALLEKVDPKIGEKEFLINKPKKKIENDMLYMCPCLKDNNLLYNPKPYQVNKDTLYYDTLGFTTSKTHFVQYAINENIDDMRQTYVKKTYNKDRICISEIPLKIHEQPYYHGEVKHYYDDGILKWKGTYFLGNLTSDYISFYPNGKKRELGRIDSKGNNIIYAHFDTSQVNYIFKGEGIIKEYDEVNQRTLYEIVKDSVVKAIYFTKNADTVFIKLEDKLNLAIHERVKPKEEKKFYKILNRITLSNKIAKLPASVKKKGDFMISIDFVIDKLGNVQDIIINGNLRKEIKDEIKRQVTDIGSFTVLTLEKNAPVKYLINFYLYPKIII